MCLDFIGNRSLPLPKYTSQADVIFPVAEKAYSFLEIPPSELRGLGVHLSHLRSDIPLGTKSNVNGRNGAELWEEEGRGERGRSRGMMVSMYRGISDRSVVTIQDFLKKNMIRSSHAPASSLPYSSLATFHDKHVRFDSSQKSKHDPDNICDQSGRGEDFHQLIVENSEMVVGKDEGDDENRCLSPLSISQVCG
jgi:hypothetical protein